MADPLVSLCLAVAVPALSVLSAAVVNRLVARWWPDPAIVAVRELDAKLERRCERIAVSQGKGKDAYKSWKVEQN